MAHGSRGAVAVIGHGFDHDRYAAGAVALITQLDHVIGIGSAGTAMRRKTPVATKPIPITQTGPLVVQVLTAMKRAPARPPIA